MALNFPASPTLNQVFTSGTRSWLWDGSSWVANNSVTNILGYIPVNKAGDTMSGGLNVPNVNAVTVTANSSGFSIAGGSSSSKTLTVSNGVTIAGTDGSTLNIGTGGTLLSGAFQASSQGTTGAQGVQGTTGSQGAQGTNGVQGNTGAQGTQGLTGPNGIQGATGTQGSTGTQGATGVQGSTGAQGTSGASILGTNNTWSGTNAFTYPSGTAIISLDSTASLGTGTGLSLAWRSYSNSGNSILATTAAMRGARENSTSGNYAGLFSIYTTDSGGSNLERFHINSSGNVGIGNTAPTALLALSTGSGAGSDATSTGTLQIRQASTGLANGGGLEFHASTFGSGYGFKWSAIDSSGVHLVLGSRENSATWTERLRITTAGNVGIGTASPANRLSVAGSGTSLFHFLGEGNTYYVLRSRNSADSAFADLVLRTDDFVIETGTSGAVTERLRLGDTGNFNIDSGTFFVDALNDRVGIGTTSPLAKLNVIGDIKIGDGSNSRGLNLLQNYMSLGETENGATTILGNNIKATDGVNSTVQVSASANDGSVWVALNYSNGITFNRIAAAAIGTQYSENAGELMRITTAGNVGIGTTSPTSKLTTYYTGIYDSNTTRFVDIAGEFFGTNPSSATNAGAFTGIRMGNITAGKYAMMGAVSEDNLGYSRSNGLSFWTSPMDTAPIERLRISSAGNVGIGTASPARRLDVRGTESLNPSLSVTTVYGGAAYMLMGNQDSAGTNTPSVIVAANGEISFGTGNSWSSNIGGTFTQRVTINSTGLAVTGALSKGSGSFRIEHPLPSKSETHQLVHSFIEGPQADLIYRGKATLVNGAASVNIDNAATMTEGTFEVLCREVQCFTTNESGWTAIRGKVTGNILTIQAQDSTCTDEISWMVIGERQDKHMMDTEWTDENGKVIVEPLKPVKELASDSETTETNS